MGVVGCHKKLRLSHRSWLCSTLTTKSRIVSWLLGPSCSLERVLEFILCSSADFIKRYCCLLSPTPVLKMKYSIDQLNIFLNILQNYPTIYNYIVSQNTRIKSNSKSHSTSSTWKLQKQIKSYFKFEIVVLFEGSFFTKGQLYTYRAFHKKEVQLNHHSIVMSASRS